MDNRRIIAVIAVVGSVLFAAQGAIASNVDLATVPPRESVQLTIYNSEDLTLVRETRSLSLKRGINRIQYSWANTLIDPTSVEIRALEREGEIEVLDTTFPGSKAQHLIWSIDSKVEGEVGFQVTYFTSGISWSADYVLVANAEETEMSLDGYVQVVNNSGEDYEGAQVRLVVGVVNLVEKIADLARRGLVPAAPASEMKAVRSWAMADAISEAEVRFDGEMGAGRPAEIVKEGLSEYFIYTIEGRQTVRDGWSKRMISFMARQVEFEILYRLRPHQYGRRPVRFFMLVNDEEHKLGTTPLPDGVVRTFKGNGRDGLSFLGQQHVNYVPIKEDIELNVGTDDEVVEEEKVLSAQRDNFVYEARGRREIVVGWDEKRRVSEEVRNYKAKAVKVEIRRIIEGDVELNAESAELYDYRTVEFAVDVKPRETFKWEYEYTVREGKNAKQSRIGMK